MWRTIFFSGGSTWTRLLLSAVTFFATNLTHAAPSKIKVGLIDELTLADQKTPSWGAYSLKGFKLGLKSSSPNHFEIVEKNVERSAIKSRLAALDLAKLDLAAIVGLREDGQALMVKSITDSKIPFITFMASSDKLLSKSGSTFSVALRNSLQVKALVDYILSRIGKNKEIALVVTRNDSYCADMQMQLSSALQARGVTTKVIAEILHGVPIPQDVLSSYSYSHQFIGLFTDEVEALSLLKVIQSQGYRGTVFGGDSWPLPFLGEQFSSIDFSKLCAVNSLSFDSNHLLSEKKFSLKYEKEYGEKSNVFSALGYDVGTILGSAISKCKGADGNLESLRTCINKTLRKSRIQGASGDFGLGADGGREAPPNVSYLRTFGDCH